MHNKNDIRNGPKKLPKVKIMFFKLQNCETINVVFNIILLF